MNPGNCGRCLLIFPSFDQEQLCFEIRVMESVHAGFTVEPCDCGVAHHKYFSSSLNPTSQKGMTEALKRAIPDDHVVGISLQVDRDPAVLQIRSDGHGWEDNRHCPLCRSDTD